MRVLFVASECAPIVKVGGLGDVIGSLPKALSKIGVDASIVLPFYEEINKKIWKPKLILRLNRETSVYKTRLPRSSVEVFLIYNEEFLSRGPVYFEKTAFVGSEKEINRFLFFSDTVSELLRRNFFQPDIVHCNDWHSAALVKLLRADRTDKSNRTNRTLFTIHNLANQGVWKGKNLMAEGIKNADWVNTVSPTYAKEILSKEYGASLEKLLQKRAKGKKLTGILNGIDYKAWPNIRHSHNHRSGCPRFGLIARLTRQKGLSLLLPLVPYFVEKYGAEFHFLGQGQDNFEKALLRLGGKYPGKVFVKIGFDAKLADKIYAQSDFFLMPSLFEPCGLGQMIAMHYGTVPVVRSTGGLKDTVRHFRTGFMFKEKSSAALAKAMRLAANYYLKKPKMLEKIRQNCLRQDFSWVKSAKRYQNLYRRLMTGY